MIHPPTRALALAFAALSLGGCFPGTGPGTETPDPRPCGEASPYYPDADADGYGDGDATPTCGEAPGFVDTPGDCDDGDAAISPEAEEICDDRDTDCDGSGELPTLWYVDDDGDGFGQTDAFFTTCWPPEGASALPGDCDDGDPLTYPGAAERCTGLDGDCDGRIDEGAQGWAFVDGDGDSFGDVPVQGCGPGVALKGDCDDGDPRVRPGAEDPPEDGIDGDCGGTEGPDPYVGFGEGSAPSIAAALEAAQDGQVIWVAPGVYPEAGLAFAGKAVHLVAAGPARETVIDAQGLDRGIVFNGGELEESILEGFTLLNGRAPTGAPGGGIYIRHASPTLMNLIVLGGAAALGGGVYSENGGPVLTGCTIEGSASEGDGGGMAFVDSTFDLTDVTVVGNVAAGVGGGIAAERSEGQLTGVRVVGNQSALGGGGAWFNNSGGTFSGGTFAGNRTDGEVGGLRLFLSTSLFYDPSFIGNVALGGRVGGLSLGTTNVTIWEGRFLGNAAAGDGGGLRAEDTTLSLDGTQFRSNRAAEGGGGISIYRAYGVLKQGLFEDNRAIGAMGSHGGGVLVNDAGLDMEKVAFEGNLAAGFASDGGALYVIGSSPSLFNALLMGNGATGYGGALSLQGSSPYLYFTTLANNWAGSGGAVAMFGAASPQLNTSLIAYNWPNNLHSCCFAEGEEGPAPYLLFTGLYNPEGREDVNPPWLDASNPQVEPGFLSYGAEEAPEDVHLGAESPLVNAGDPSFRDPDGSVSDPGYFGGEGAGVADLDRDGLPVYFWPGGYGSPPAGVHAPAYDCDDRDPSVGACP